MAPINNYSFEPAIASGDDGMDPFAALLVEPFKPIEDAAFGFDFAPQVTRRTSGSSTPFTPFDPAEDDFSQYLQLFPEDDAPTPPLVYDEATHDASLFGLTEPPSPAFAFRSYAPAFTQVDPSLALRSPTDDPLPFTCSPVELTADSPPFAVERALPQPAPTRRQESEPVHDQEEQSEQAEVTAPAPKSRKRKASAKFTGSRNTEIPLVDLTAPVADRTYTGESRTARKAVPVLYQRQVKKQKLDIITETGEVLPEHQKEIEAKRLANTVAARRSRQRKAEHLKTLEDAIESLTAQLEAEQQKCKALEQENASLRALRT